MKTFQLPKDSWLRPEAFARLLVDYNDCWERLEGDAATAEMPVFTALNNRAMLLKFFLEQAFGSGSPLGKSLQILERDFGGFSDFSKLWLAEAVKEEVDWLVLALSFSDFRFHLFPVGTKGYAMPFCVSPMMCACVQADTMALSAMTPLEFAQAQLSHVNWSVVEQRIVCLEFPLNIFEDATDCVEDSCESESESGLPIQPSRAT